MNTDRLSNLLALAANLGVVVGIVFLVLEIRQTGAIATAEIRLNYAAGWRSVDQSRQEESFSALLTKSIESPEELSLEEFIRLDGYYTGILDQVLNAQTARIAGLVDGSFEEVAKNISAIYFSNEFARSWWKQVRVDWSAANDGEFQRVMDKTIVAGEVGRSQRLYMGVRDELSKGGS